MTTHDDALPALSDADILRMWQGDSVATRPVLGSRKVLDFARAVEQRVLAALAARGGDQRPTAWALAASLDILADRGEVNCTLWSDATRPDQEWTEPLYADDPRLTWGVPHAGTIRCLRAAEDRIRAGEPPAEVFADYGWTMDAAPPAPSQEAMRAALEFCEFAWRDVPMNEYAFERLERTIALLRAALGGESQS
jgi:hypothetical protein